MSEQPVFVANPDSAVQVFELRDLFAIHAPPVPEWFTEKFLKGEEGKSYVPDEFELLRMTEWPWFYADMVLQRRDEHQS